MLIAAITFPGGSPVSGPVLFDASTGKDMGMYVAPGGKFTQKCVRVRNPAIPNFFVDFRADADGTRDEVVFWNGEVDPVNKTVPSGYTRDLPGHQVEISKSGAVIYSATIPAHVWATRWRYQSAPRPLVRTPAQIFSDGFFPHMSRKAARLEGNNLSTGQPWSGKPYSDPSGKIIQPVPISPVGVYSTFMPPIANGYKLGLTTGVESGGNRPELGAMSEWAGDYLVNGTRSSLDAIRQQAEMVSGEWFFFLPDLNTGAPINFKQDIARYKTFLGNEDLDSFYRAAFENQKNGWEIHEFDAHIQMHPYLAYALTEDAYYLEGLQYIHGYGIGNKGAAFERGNVFGRLNDVPNGSAGLNGRFTICSYVGEIRTVGNGIRNLAMVYKTAPDNPPSWLLPKKYYADISSDYSAVIYKLWTTSRLNVHAVFRQLSSDEYFQVFMQCYACMGMALADLVGMPTGNNPTWKDTLTFYFGMIDGLTNPDSGWDTQRPQVHNIQSDADPENPAAGALNFQNYKTWKALSDATKEYMTTGASFPTAPFPGNRQAGSMQNCNMMYAASAMAMSRGIPAASRAKAFMDQFIDYNYPNHSDIAMYIPMENKCAFDGTTNANPPGEIEMASTKLAIGETKHVTLTVTPADADQTGLAYSAAPDGLVTLAADVGGVNVTGVAAGVATITATLNGLTATAEADVSLPLATAIVLSWDS